MAQNKNLQSSSWFRPEIEAMAGYTPGEQPKDKQLLKLNTNENPYPPSPAVARVLKTLAYEQCRLYPDPRGQTLRQVIADLYDLGPDNVILGNGSDDILTMAVRALVGQGGKIAQIEPSYSLYPVLARIQGAAMVSIPLTDQFQLPANFAKLAAGSGARLFILARPNAPTGNTFPLEEIAQLCRVFPGVVLLDEAYAEFARDNGLGLLREFENLLVMRTLSKSYALAGVRLGYALAAPELISGLLKVKDSYNVNFLTQQIARAALLDQKYFQKIRDKILNARQFLTEGLRGLDFRVFPSEANFVFASPPGGDAAGYYHYLRANAILVRYFPGKKTGKAVRITVGTRSNMAQLIKISREYMP